MELSASSQRRSPYHTKGGQVGSYGVDGRGARYPHLLRLHPCKVLNDGRAALVSDPTLANKCAAKLHVVVRTINKVW